VRKLAGYNFKNYKEFFATYIMFRIFRFYNLLTEIFLWYTYACACTRKKRNIKEFNNLWIALKTIALKMW